MIRFRRGMYTLLLAWSATLPLAADESILTPQKKAHWAWQFPRRQMIPRVRQADSVRNPIDAFILARLESEGILPAPPADPATLLRRLHFDLIGLPPTPREVDAFVAAWMGASAQRQTVLERVIDDLLASPHYGERWGRHWLDLARFAESNGYEFDEIRPDAWRYRDYVIRAFNSDKPYDQFILEQLAGDELFPDDADAVIATGFNLLGPDMTDSSNQAQRRQNTLDDMTETAGLVFMGLTIGCARCHDHKFEPIMQADFYRVQAFFAPAVFRKDVPVASPDQITAHVKAQKQYQLLIQPLLDAQAVLEAPHRAKVFETKLSRIADEARLAHQTPEARRTAKQRQLVDQTARLVAITTNDLVAVMNAADKGQHQRLQKEIEKQLERKPAPLPVAMGLKDQTTALAPTYLLERGELNQRGEEIQPAWPLILSSNHREARPTFQPPTSQTTGRRTALARWLVDPSHPLTARVMVNRLWQHHFGRGLVATPSDFGVRGDAPSHPELLDWLATEFVANGWSVKHMHKLMLLSATYQQDSRLRLSAPSQAVDPENRLLWRMNRQRLEGEIIRDSLLAVSKRLNPKMGGRGVFPPLPPDSKFTAKEWPVTAKTEEHTRRSVYIFARRNLRFLFLQAFDAPDTNHSCPKREKSTTGPQALTMLNSADVVAAAEALAQRLQREATATDDQVRLAFRIAFARAATDAELDQARQFLRESPLVELCRALLNANEFVYID